MPLRALAVPAYVAGLHLAFRYLAACGSLRSVLAEPLNNNSACCTIVEAYRFWHESRADGTPGLGALDDLLACAPLCGEAGPEFDKLFTTDRTLPIDQLQKILSLAVHTWPRDAYYLAAAATPLEARARIVTVLGARVRTLAHGDPVG